MVDPGNLIVADNTPLTTIVTEDPVWAYFDIDEHTSLRIQRLEEKNHVGSQQMTDAEVDLGLVDEQGFPHKGKIDFVDNQVDTNTGTLRLRGVFQNSNGLLTPGLFVRIRLPIGKPHQAMIVPEEALQTDQGRKYVFVINNDSDVVEYRSLTVGDTYSDGLRIVEDGLKPDDRVIVSGLQRVKPGLKVSPKLETERTDAVKPPEAKAPAAKPADLLPGNKPNMMPDSIPNSKPAEFGPGSSTSAPRDTGMPAFGTDDASGPQFGPANPKNPAGPRGSRPTSPPGLSQPLPLQPGTGPTGIGPTGAGQGGLSPTGAAAPRTPPAYGSAPSDSK